MSFKQDTDGRQWDYIKDDLKSWRNSCPRHMKPYSRLQGENTTSHLFPAIWFLQPCHGARFIKAEASQQELIRQLLAFTQPPQVGVVRPSAQEVKNWTLDSRNLEKSVRHMHRDGLVVVEDVVPHEDIDILNKKMIEDAHTLQARGDKGPFNYNKGNIQQDAPPVSEYFSPSIFTNPIATQITTAMMGPRPKWTFCSANSAMATLPGGTPQRQPVHSDADFAHPDHPFALVVNIPLVTTTPENGSTEIWLGTHNGFGLDAQEGAHGERASGRIREELLRQRQEISPPLQPVIKKGSIVGDARHDPLCTVVQEQNET
ncbi:hypothetical protein FOXG_11424 [Fusarium oxysporum f. sp. lycopersici 4287]|uniref:Uncharacterized protein n=2 Tax=Fusarium oxysporum TaxID=5507 RepID=A0A0J9VLG4_FUSO4|nr:hypothetical protein FOXG_11424 [Fusarium oxysporum f. sp. lycopersici 4287]KNB11570.1 hypothetical protein FOXG_11424 [Fusarium oxysporum f. sp. lycopersici 4287]